MSRSSVAPIALCAGLVALFAVGQIHAQTQAAAPQFDARFKVGDQIYTGTTSFSIDKAGKVSGTMRLTSPVAVDAELGGTVKDGVWTVEFGYKIPEQACEGRLAGTAKVAADQTSIAGTVTISGACTQEPMTATMTFTKRAAAK